MSNILYNSILMERLCDNLDRDFQCKKIFDCDIACPLWLAYRIQNDFVPLYPSDIDVAYKATIRKSIKKKKAQEILESVFGIDLETIRETLLMEGEEKRHEDKS